MSKEEIIGRLRRTAAVAVIRVDDSEGLEDVAEALQRGGIDFIEITLTVPGALQAIRKCREAFGTKVVLGAGTVMDVKSAKSAIEAGAMFIVSPHTDPEVVRHCVNDGTIVIPGALTPSEVVYARQVGADIVKIFSARLGGSDYIRDLKGPLPDIEVLPTGGITIDNAPEFLAAGAIAIGIGGAIASRSAIQNKNLEQIYQNAKRLRSVIDGTRSKKPAEHGS